MAAVCVEKVFTMPAMGVKLLPHKLAVHGRVVAACQVELSMFTGDVKPRDILVEVNGVSLLGSAALAMGESAQASFDVIIDTLLAQPVPRRVRLFRLARDTPEADGTSVLLLDPEETWVLLREAPAAELAASGAATSHARSGSGGARTPVDRSGAGPTPPQRLSLIKPQLYGLPSPALSPKDSSPRTVAGRASSASSDTSAATRSPTYSSYRNAPSQRPAWPPSPFQVRP